VTTGNISYSATSIQFGRPFEIADSCAQYLCDDQSIEIPCPCCLKTAPKTLDWIQANDRYPCAGSNTEIIIDQDTLFAQQPSDSTCVPRSYALAALIAGVAQAGLPELHCDVKCPQACGRRNNPTMLPIRILYLCTAAHLHLSPDNAASRKIILAVQHFGV
jgi:hypothetical protein